MLLQCLYKTAHTCWLYFTNLVEVPLSPKHCYPLIKGPACAPVPQREDELHLCGAFTIMVEGSQKDVAYEP